MKKKIYLSIIRTLVKINRKIIEKALKSDKKLVAKINRIQKPRLK